MIYRATAADSSALTRIAFASKRYWRYPEEYYTIWKDELTITGRYIDTNEVYVYRRHRQVAAFFSLVRLEAALEYRQESMPAGLWLDHMFVTPALIGCGIGAEMMTCAVSRARELGHGSLYLLAEPQATGFYLKMGCVFERDFPSSIRGRTTPLMRRWISAPSTASRGQKSSSRAAGQ